MRGSNYRFLTAKERDNETNLDYFLARYYSSTQGRFTSPDEFTGGPDELYYFVDDASDNPTFYADLANPQSLNKYQYTYNNPLRYTDQDGHCPECAVIRAGVTLEAIPVPIPHLKAAGAVLIAGGLLWKAASWASETCPECGQSPEGGVIRMWHENRQAAANQASQDQNQNGQQTPPQKQGDYSSVKDPKNPRDGGDFTPRQKREARDQNKQQNGGQMKSDKDGKPINTPIKTPAGGRRDPREAQLDHKKSKANGGSNRSKNIRVISAQENQKKGKKNEP